jgi:hypothetical protein
MKKNQSNSGVFSLETPCDQKVSIYKNERSGNYFFAKTDLDAENRVKATNVWIDENGSVCITVK